MYFRFLACCAWLLCSIDVSAAAPDSEPPSETQPELGSVIFIHPDGASAATWAAGRAFWVGPDGDLHWDRLPAIAVYRGHMADNLTATSNGGATTHAFGIKVSSDAFGRTAGGDRGQDIVDDHGRSQSVAKQALAAGLSVGVVQSGTSTEPGTACFLTVATSRHEHEDIAAQLIASGADIILGGGERYFLPAGVHGTHGAGQRSDGRNLVEEAQQLGFTIVHNKKELLALPDDTTRVLGLFASKHTFNAATEEKLAASQLPLYQNDSPSIAEMTDAALRILTRSGKRFLLVVEEEGTDNFGNHNNAAGELEAIRRADEAIGLAREYIRNHPRTLLMTTADSDAGGMRMVGVKIKDGQKIPKKLPKRDRNGAPMDGAQGTGTEPFLSAPDQFGKRLPFAIVWASNDDVSGGVLVRAAGFRSELVHGSMDNTDIARIIRLILFGNEADHDLSSD